MMPTVWQVKAVTEEMGIGFLGIGFQPKWKRSDIPIMPKVWFIPPLKLLKSMRLGGIKSEYPLENI